MKFDNATFDIKKTLLTLVIAVTCSGSSNTYATFVRLTSSCLCVVNDGIDNDHNDDDNKVVNCM